MAKKYLGKIESEVWDDFEFKYVGIVSEEEFTYIQEGSRNNLFNGAIVYNEDQDTIEIDMDYIEFQEITEDEAYDLTNNGLIDDEFTDILNEMIYDEDGLPLF